MNTRIIPALCLIENALVKTKGFGSPQYIGDPLNTVRIFNELEVDELCFLGIRSTLKRKEPDYNLLRSIATECFMPLSYGGGISSFEVARKVFNCGIEKIILNSAALQNTSLIKECADHYGSQAIVLAIDVKKSLFGQPTVRSHSGTVNTGRQPVAWAKEVEAAGAGEIILTSINREGTWSGFDTQLIKEVSAAVSIPVIAHGGAGSVEHIYEAVKSGASAVAAGNLFLYQKKGLGVLVNFPKAALNKVMTGV